MSKGKTCMKVRGEEGEGGEVIGWKRACFPLGSHSPSTMEAKMDPLQHMDRTICISYLRSYAFSGCGMPMPPMAREEGPLIKQRVSPRGPNVGVPSLGRREHLLATRWLPCCCHTRTLPRRTSTARTAEAQKQGGGRGGGRWKAREAPEGEGREKARTQANACTCGVSSPR